MGVFLLFAGGNYDRCGGLSDYHSTYKTLEDAFNAADKLIGTDNENGTTYDWYQILDTQNPDGYFCDYFKRAKKNDLITCNP